MSFPKKKNKQTNKKTFILVFPIWVIFFYISWSHYTFSFASHNVQIFALYTVKYGRRTTLKCVRLFDNVCLIHIRFMWINVINVQKEKLVLGYRKHGKTGTLVLFLFQPIPFHFLRTSNKILSNQIRFSLFQAWCPEGWHVLHGKNAYFFHKIYACFLHKVKC